MPKFKDLTNQRFGSWTVISRAADHVTPAGNKFTQWNCVCDCGTRKIVIANTLLGGRSLSCGCKQQIKAVEVCRQNFSTHGESKTRLYKIWVYMKKRCTNPKASNYADYGGRGISVCEEWSDDYLAFRNWALSNGYSDNLSIDRIDVDKNYEPSNCRWTDRVVQSNNRRSNRFIEYNGESHTVAEWSKILNIPYKRLHKNLQKGKSIQTILNT